MLDGKRLLLIIAGGIAAYKCLELIRLLRARGMAVQVVLTRAGARFVTPLALAAISGQKVHTDLFDTNDEAEIGHIQLSRSADLVVVAPASADIIARMAGGLASDLATTALMATDKPVLIAPAMNVAMWKHPANQRNIARLEGDGIGLVGPGEGDMACGEYGPGRMAEPAEIVSAVEAALSAAPEKLAAGATNRLLAGKKVVITAGPTHEPIDPVRYIANRSSGRQGYALAEAALALGARTIIISGPVYLDLPEGAEVIPVETAQEMFSECKHEMPCDIAICAAAVADWRIAHIADSKIKKSAGSALPKLELAENPDILSFIAHMKKDRPAVVAGFAAETGDVLKNARKKLAAKGCDVIVANDVSAEAGVFGGTHNRVHVISAEGEDSWPEMTKVEVAERLMAQLAGLLDAKG